MNLTKSHLAMIREFHRVGGGHVVRNYFPTKRAQDLCEAGFLFKTSTDNDGYGIYILTIEGEELAKELAQPFRSAV